LPHPDPLLAAFHLHKSLDVERRIAEDQAPDLFPELDCGQESDPPAKGVAKENHWFDHLAVHESNEVRHIVLGEIATGHTL
jgi:hypothetical protein